MNMRLLFRSVLPQLDSGLKRSRLACAEPSCERKQSHIGSSDHAGIHFGEKWFCSPSCFASGSHAALALLSSHNVVEMPRQPRLSLGLALLSRGYVSEEQLRAVTAQVQSAETLLESVLLEKGWVNEKQLAAARGVQWGQPALGIAPLDKAVETNLPISLLRAYSAAPIHFSTERKRLVLGFVYRVEYTLLQSIEQITGYRTEPCFITPTEFNQVIARFRHLPDYEEVISDRPANIAQIAACLADYASEVPGGEAKLARCKSWIWARIAGDENTIDAIFATNSASRDEEETLSAFAPNINQALS